MPLTCPVIVLLSLAQASAELGYSVSGLRKLVKKRAIRSLQVGRGRIKIDERWIAEFKDANSTPIRTEPQRAPVATPTPKRKKSRLPELSDSRHGFDLSLVR
jgi:hypothetical protein